MTVIRGFLSLLLFLLLGEALVTLLHLPLSSGVAGMLLLTLWLLLRGGMDDTIAAAAQPLISVLALLIMPGVVGVFFVAGEYADQWLAVAAALVLGTLLSVATTLWLMQRFTPPLSEAQDDE